ncbi:hypothetical protein QO004_000090 [Rhizobium mesoamericanum]|uniref:hypothetical protein n=1 Tax=Rhizobium mesoamericanum TaxID=1079800 RepID=UPI00278548ED|nr:hypothetical protein [Rhizobium mesoamericanum]MDQ0558317.1 hypothetical protein [Rhizobium mesoamericanum]
MDLIATRTMTYGTRRLAPGDRFTASNMNGRLLVAIKKAKAAPDEPEASAQADALTPATKERRRSPKRSKE